jgi:hypothetical protein
LQENQQGRYQEKRDKVAKLRAENAALKKEAQMLGMKGLHLDFLILITNF